MLVSEYAQGGDRMSAALRVDRMIGRLKAALRATTPAIPEAARRRAAAAVAAFDSHHRDHQSAVGPGSRRGGGDRERRCRLAFRHRFPGGSMPGLHMKEGWSR